MNGSAQFDDAHKRRVGEIGGNGEAFDALGRHLAADGRWAAMIGGQEVFTGARDYSHSGA